MNFYKYTSISQVTILDQDIEKFHHPTSFSHAPPLSIAIPQSELHQHKLNLSFNLI